MANSHLVEMRGVSKSFGAVLAIQKVDLVLAHDEVLGLIGDNAAGKSTLMKILSGAYIPDEGEILLDGNKVHLTGPEDARELGVEMVYQDFALVNKQDIASNIFLGREIRMGGLGRLVNMFDRKRMDLESEALLERLKIPVQSVRLKVERLSGGQRQAVAIARSMAFNAKVVIMDEPTASLSVAAIRKVLDLVKQLKEHGVSIIIISHRLEDILHVSDRIMILRRGRRVGNLQNAGLKITDLVEYMVGARDDFAEKR